MRAAFALAFLVATASAPRELPVTFSAQVLALADDQSVVMLLDPMDVPVPTVAAQTLEDLARADGRRVSRHGAVAALTPAPTEAPFDVLDTALSTVGPVLRADYLGSSGFLIEVTEGWLPARDWLASVPGELQRRLLEEPVSLAELPDSLYDATFRLAAHSALRKLGSEVRGLHTVRTAPAEVRIRLAAPWEGSGPVLTGPGISEYIPARRPLPGLAVGPSPAARVDVLGKEVELPVALEVLADALDAPLVAFLPEDDVVLPPLGATTTADRLFRVIEQAAPLVWRRVADCWVLTQDGRWTGFDPVEALHLALHDLAPPASGTADTPQVGLLAHFQDGRVRDYAGWYESTGDGFRLVGGANWDLIPAALRREVTAALLQTRQADWAAAWHYFAAAKQRAPAVVQLEPNGRTGEEWIIVKFLPSTGEGAAPTTRLIHPLRRYPFGESVLPTPLPPRDPLTRSELDTPVTLAHRIVAIESLLEELAEPTGCRFQVSEAMAERRVAVFAADTPARDLLRALARAVGGHWARDPDDPARLALRSGWSPGERLNYLDTLAEVYFHILLESSPDANIAAVSRSRLERGLDPVRMSRYRGEGLALRDLPPSQADAVYAFLTWEALQEFTGRDAQGALLLLGGSEPDRLFTRALGQGYYGVSVVWDAPDGPRIGPVTTLKLE